MQVVGSGIASLRLLKRCRIRRLPQTLYTGDISELDGVCTFAEALEVDAQLSLQAAVADFEEGSQVADQYAPALGLVLALMSLLGYADEFSARRFAYQGDLQLYRGPLIHLIAGCAIVLSRFGTHDDPMYWSVAKKRL